MSNVHHSKCTGLGGEYGMQNARQTNNNKNIYLQKHAQTMLHINYYYISLFACRWLFEFGWIIDYALSHCSACEFLLALPLSLCSQSHKRRTDKMQFVIVILTHTQTSDAISVEQFLMSHIQLVCYAVATATGFGTETQRTNASLTGECWRNANKR